MDAPETFTAALARQSWDVIIADHSMPHFSGLKALALLKESGPDLPFIIVSGAIDHTAGVETKPVILDDKLNTACSSSNLQTNVFGFRVSDDIGERFLDDSEEGRLDRLGEPRRRWLLGLQSDPDAVGLFELRGQSHEGGQQSQVI